MKISKNLIIILIVLLLGAAYYLLSPGKKPETLPVPVPSPTPTQESPTIVPTATPSTVYPDTQHAIQAFLANKYNKPLSDVKITVDKEVQGFASGSVLFGQGGPGEGGMWLAVLGNGWEVVWDGNGNVDCNKMRTQYGFPDTILKPNFCE